MSTKWIPLAPMRWIVRRNNIPGTASSDVNPLNFYDNVLQQLWGEHQAFRYETETKLEPTGKYRWEDVPLMDEADAGLDCWSKNE